MSPIRAADPSDIERAARVIHTFGQPGKYYSVTKIYLVSPDGRHRWWTEDRHFTDATLVNRATTAVNYGIQNAPSTKSATWSQYDEVATYWDAEHLTTPEESDRIRSLLAEVRGPFPPHVLDIGCGTGRVLDLELASARRYAALDRSQAMLNVLVRKHPGVAAVYPVDVADALASRMFTPGQFDWVVLDSAVVLSSDQRREVRALARRAVVHMDGDSWQVEPISASSRELSAAPAR
jgi:SAM-dependent methyltransferase